MFAVTNYWESGKAEVEIAQGKAIADAAKVRSFPQFQVVRKSNVS